MNAFRHIFIPFIFIISSIAATCCGSLSPASSNGEPAAGATREREIDGMTLVYAPSGSFLMGSTEAEVQAAYESCLHYWPDCDYGRFADELPQHQVTLDGFWIDQTEVSNRQYRLCVEAGACTPPECWEGSQFDDPDQPVVCVSWNQARAYCAWVGGSLPTEAQWEYAARGPESYQYPWGNEFDGVRLNYCDATCGRARADKEFNDGQYYTAPVGSYPGGASWCGALDMAGNVSEWVADWFAQYGDKALANPLGPASGGTRVLRGGSWFFTRLDARSAWRDALPQETWFDDLGFRCALSSGEPGQ